MRTFTKVNDRYGKWTVLELRGSKSLCRCECGTIKEVWNHTMKNGSSTNCGCVPQKRSVLIKDRTLVRDKLLFAKAKSNATSRSRIEFTLTREEVVELMTSDCYYCGEHPSNTIRAKTTGETWNYSGIDRVDPTKGYVQDNVVSCCWTCNCMKRDMQLFDFFEHIETICNRHIW